MFWVISVYFNIRNTLPKSGTFLLGHPVYPLHRSNLCLLYQLEKLQGNEYITSFECRIYQCVKVQAFLKTIRFTISSNFSMSKATHVL